jgi:Mn-containing catalase
VLITLLVFGFEFFVAQAPMSEPLRRAPFAVVFLAKTVITTLLGREVCGYLLVRGSVHAHAYALVLKNLTGVAIEKMLPVPKIELGRIPECQTYLVEGRHRMLYTNSPSDYHAMASIWSNGETALPGDPPGELEVVEGVPDGGRMPDLDGLASAFTPEYAPEEMFEIAQKLYAASR